MEKRLTIIDTVPIGKDAHRLSALISDIIASLEKGQFITLPLKKVAAPKSMQSKLKTPGPPLLEYIVDVKKSIRILQYK